MTLLTLCLVVAVAVADDYGRHAGYWRSGRSLIGGGRDYSNYYGGGGGGGGGRMAGYRGDRQAYRNYWKRGDYANDYADYSSMEKPSKGKGGKTKVKVKIGDKKMGGSGPKWGGGMPGGKSEDSEEMASTMSSPKPKPSEEPKGGSDILGASTKATKSMESAEETPKPKMSDEELTPKKPEMSGEEKPKPGMSGEKKPKPDMSEEEPKPKPDMSGEAKGKSDEAKNPKMPWLPSNPPKGRGKKPEGGSCPRLSNCIKACLSKMKPGGSEEKEPEGAKSIENKKGKSIENLGKAGKSVESKGKSMEKGGKWDMGGGKMGKMGSQRDRRMRMRMRGAFPDYGGDGSEDMAIDPEDYDVDW